MNAFMDCLFITKLFTDKWFYLELSYTIKLIKYTFAHIKIQFGGSIEKFTPQKKWVKMK